MASESKSSQLFLYALSLVVAMLAWFLVDLNYRVRAYEEETPIIILQEMRDDIRAIKKALHVE